MSTPGNQGEEDGGEKKEKANKEKKYLAFIQYALSHSNI